MRVLFDLVAARHGGPETVALDLLRRLVRLDRQASWELLVAGPRRLLYRELAGADNVRVRAIPAARVRLGPRRLVHEHLGIALLTRRLRPDVYVRFDGLFTPAQWATGVPALAVLHKSPLMASGAPLSRIGASNRYHRLVERFAVRAARAVVTVSHHAAAQFVRRYPSLRGRLQVIHHGVDPARFSGPAPDRAWLRRTLGAERYLLYVANHHPHKNICRLVQAYGRLLRQGPRPERLVIVGGARAPEEQARIRRAIGDRGLGARVRLADFVELDRLGPIYRGASAYVCPSLLETFGLTPLEAMAAGVPVACSNRSALPEVCGDAVEYFDPLDPGAMAAAMARVLDDAGLRRRLLERGQRNLHRFGWDRAAELYLEQIAGLARGGWRSVADA
jgi:glycosyltransferase involved in cell wall biosynthesis